VAQKKKSKAHEAIPVKMFNAPINVKFHPVRGKVGIWWGFDLVGSHIPHGGDNSQNIQILT